MTDHLLPATVPIATAAILAGLSPATFRTRCLASGLVQREGRRVSLPSLASYLGHPINPEAYLSADRRRDYARSAQKAWRLRRHNRKE